MYAAGRGAVRLLLVAAFVVAVAGVARRPRQPRQPRSKATRVYRPNMDAGKLLKHVMMREKEWTDVLQEPIKLLGEPPHKGRGLAAPPVGPRKDAASGEDEEASLYDVREIVATVTRYYSTIRSFVEYGAKAVRRALACYTFKQVMYQTSSISLLMVKEAEANIVLQTANAFKKNTASFVDILSAVPDADLSVLLRAYWESIKLLQYDGIQRLEKLPYPEALTKSMTNLTGNVNIFLSKYCMPYATEDDFFQRTGVPQKTPLIKDASIETMMSIEQIANMTREQAQHMARTARSLGIVTMPDHLWSSLFFYRGRPRPDSTYLDVAAPPAGEAAASKSEGGPSVAGSSTSEAGPSTSDAGPSTSEAGPSTSGAGPS
ncbi:uncharacterized protein LOC132952133 [Metopolophium dirhodum]|uniref:uncharacterized protein LOC132952133 n=1 Tax=Metopolophium dirhodum TaxID=44670 RepID=UPI00298FF3B5|nr:uncharacterized protein LOC132952133 [Metopolophium dirhodum]